MRLIDADALLEEAKRLSGPQTGDGWDNWGVYALIERQKTVLDWCPNDEKMEVNKIVNIKEDLDITGATLLSIEEAKKLPIELRGHGDFWWLRSPGYEPYYAAYVSYGGSICDQGSIVSSSLGVVRPALKISNLESSNFQIGDQFVFDGKFFQIILDNLALCLTDIGKCWFRESWKVEDANDYEKSDVKKYVDNWFNKAIKGNNNGLHCMRCDNCHLVE